MKLSVLLASLLILSCKNDKQRAKEEFDKTERMLKSLQDVQADRIKTFTDRSKTTSDYIKALNREAYDSLKPTTDSLLSRLEYLSTKL